MVRSSPGVLRLHRGVSLVGVQEALGGRLCERGAPAEAEALLVLPQRDGPRGHELHRPGQHRRQALLHESPPQGRGRVCGRDPHVLLQDLRPEEAASRSLWDGEGDGAARDAHPRFQRGRNRRSLSEGRQERRMGDEDFPHMPLQKRPRQVRGVDVVQQHDHLGLQVGHRLLQGGAEVATKRRGACAVLAASSGLRWGLVEPLAEKVGRGQGAVSQRDGLQPRRLRDLHRFHVGAHGGDAHDEARGGRKLRDAE
mmetsp:Transcript_102720/g.296949  ORF Transcript_102720/g.296949 Transcript_102720/m.296949 type:complete len:254 (+) Transcript_102720:65-826(+)